MAERAGREFGCFITARQYLGRLPRVPLYWYLDTYPTRRLALAARGARGTVVESLGKVWLFTIAPDGSQPPNGRLIAKVGPLPFAATQSYAAWYLEGIFKPGMATRVHRHPGVEAFYTLSGSMCIETPNDKLVQRAGGKGVFVPGETPMKLTATGVATRRSLALILQDLSKPWMTAASDWSPKGLCGASRRAPD